MTGHVDARYKHEDQLLVTQLPLPWRGKNAPLASYDVGKENFVWGRLQTLVESRCTKTPHVFRVVRDDT